MASVSTCILDVPALPCVVDQGRRHDQDRVFDAWSWCASDVLEWRRPALSTNTGAWSPPDITGENPSGLVFVMHDVKRGEQHEDHAFLPRELARLHAFGYGLEDEMALAPWAIDDATDLLYEHRVRPRDVFWLAATSLEALVWGLHDWAHFHNHGPFEQRAMTELQCDLVALEWVRRNASKIGIEPDYLEKVARDLAALSRARFAEEAARPPVCDFDTLFLGPYPGPLG